MVKGHREIMCYIYPIVNRCAWSSINIYLVLIVYGSSLLFIIDLTTLSRSWIAGHSDISGYFLDLQKGSLPWYSICLEGVLHEKLSHVASTERFGYLISSVGIWVINHRNNLDQIWMWPFRYLKLLMPANMDKFRENLQESKLISFRFDSHYYGLIYYQSIAYSKFFSLKIVHQQDSLFNWFYSF